MSGYDPNDWKWQVFDKFEEFIDSVYKIDESAVKIFLSDKGQVNLAWDSVRHLFPLSHFQNGDILTAIELGKLIGGYHSLWSVLLASTAYYERLTRAAADVKSLRVQIDTILAKSMPNAMQGPATGIIHLLEAMMSPTMIDAVRANRKRFETVLGSVFELVRAQEPAEFRSFMSGYGAAFACCPIDVNGLPIGSDKMAAMVAICRPFLMKQGYSATDLQDCVDGFLQAPLTGHPERFAKHLQRRKASLRGKGRPAKKPAKKAESDKKKSDNL